MKRHALLLIAGWARPPSSLTALADCLRGEHDVVVTSPSDLLARAGGLPREAAPAGGPSHYARALRALIAAQPAPVVLAGWSMGGLVALEAVAGRPADIAALVMIGSTARLCAAEDYPCGPPAGIVRAMQQSILQAPLPALQQFLAAVHAPGVLAPETLQAEAQEALDLGMDVLMHGMAYLGTADWRAALPGIRLPALVVHGALDRIIPCAAGEFLAAGLAGSAQIIHPAAGHDLPTHSPETAAKNLLDFMRERVP